MLGWITGDVQERGWSCALLSLSPWPPALLGVGEGTALLTSPCLQDLLQKTSSATLIPGLPEGGGGETSSLVFSLARKKKIIVVIIIIILF